MIEQAQVAERFEIHTQRPYCTIAPGISKTYCVLSPSTAPRFAYIFGKQRSAACCTVLRLPTTKILLNCRGVHPGFPPDADQLDHSVVSYDMCAHSCHHLTSPYFDASWIAPLLAMLRVPCTPDIFSRDTLRRIRSRRHSGSCGLWWTSQGIM